MIIRGVTLTPVAVRRHTGFSNHHVLVRIASDEQVGVGEMSDLSHLPRYMPDLTDLEKTMTLVLVGRDARDLSAINGDLLQHFPSSNDYYDKSNFIRAGIDIALHDLVAKGLGEPVSTLLGGRVRDRFKVCYPIFRHRHETEVDANLAVAGRRLEQGFDVIRLYVGANLDADVKFLRELRVQFDGRVKVKSLDFSHVLNWKEARTALRRFAEFEFDMIESPSKRNDVEGLAKLRETIDVPVSEHVWSTHQLRTMVRYDAVDIFNIAPVFIGGLFAAREAFAVARCADKRTLLGTTQELSIGTAAQAQLGTAMAGLTDTCDATGPILYKEDVTSAPVRYENGFLVAPPANVPGLGIEVDIALVKKLMAPLGWESNSPAAVLDRTVTA